MYGFRQELELTVRSFVHDYLEIKKVVGEVEYCGGGTDLVQPYN